MTDETRTYARTVGTRRSGHASIELRACASVGDARTTCACVAERIWTTTRAFGRAVGSGLEQRFAGPAEVQADRACRARLAHVVLHVEPAAISGRLGAFPDPAVGILGLGLVLSQGLVLGLGLVLSQGLCGLIEQAQNPKGDQPSLG